jgi:hypothetical protein
MTRQRSVIFNADEMRATLDGRMTAFVRPVKPTPVLHGNKSAFQGHWAICDGLWYHVTPNPNGTFDQNSKGFRSPFGASGDKLVVKETWQLGYPTGEEDRFTLIKPSGVVGCRVFRRADYPDGSGPPKWRSATNMPRYWSRLTLTVAEVRALRVQDLGPHKACLLGFSPEDDSDLYWDAVGGVSVTDVLEKAWDDRYAKRGAPWKDNPWCWYVAFAREENKDDG